MMRFCGAFVAVSLLVQAGGATMQRVKDGEDADASAVETPDAPGEDEPSAAIQPANITSQQKQFVMPRPTTPALALGSVANNAIAVDGAITSLKSKYGSVCSTMDVHYLVGGIGNSMAIVNVAMDFALRNGLQWIMPEIRPPAHKTGDDFRFLFGEPKLCPPRLIPLYLAACPFVSDPTALPNDVPGMCDVSELFVYRNTQIALPNCDATCSAMVMISSVVGWGGFDYSRTGAVLTQMYWQGLSQSNISASSELQFPITTAVHVRLGDVEGSGSSKEAKPDELSLIAEGLTSVLNPACIKVEMHTDGETADPTVQKVKEMWNRAGVAAVDVFDINTKEIDTFHRMTTSTILIGGASGFVRLAAIVGNPAIKIFVNDPDDSHSIAFLDGVTGFDPMFEASAVVPALQKNDVLQKASEACNTWLKK